MIERKRQGEVARKPHTALCGADGALRYEECLTREGFEGPYTIVYHQHRPHEGRIAPTTRGFAVPERSAPPALARRHYRSREIAAGGAPCEARVALLHNDDVVLSVARPDRSDTSYFVNGDADDLLFVLEGSGRVKSVLGELTFRALDYVCIPKGVLHRIELDPGAQHWLVMECFGGVGVPQHFRNAAGQLRMDAPYSHRDFRAPELGAPHDEGTRSVLVKRAGRFSELTLPHSPFDVVGWDGAVYPFAFSILDFQPRVGQIHLPPTVHGTFQARGAFICSFVPRPLDFHPEAIPCPYPHSSVDIDEVLFYASGDFTSRRGIASGSISHHPAGIPHGPHPGAYEASRGAQRTSELAVMLDLARPLARTAAAEAIEDRAYHDSFSASTDGA